MYNLLSGRAGRGRRNPPAYKNNGHHGGDELVPDGEPQGNEDGDASEEVCDPA